MKKFCILTEGGKEMGIGHITRCLSLYEELSDRGYEPEFFIYGGNSIEQHLSGLNYKILDWLQCDISFLENTTCIIDSYLAEDGRLTEIAETADKCFFIDDNNQREYPQGVVINPSIHGDKLPYPEKQGVKYLLGKDYIILRKPFRQKPVKKINERIEELTVTIGGTDVLGLTKTICTALKPYAGIKKNILNVTDREILEQSDNTFRFFSNLNAYEMQDILLKSDLVISAGGQTCHELVQTSTPSVLIKAADNQANNIKAMTESGLAVEISPQEAGDLDKVLELMDYNMRERLIANMSRYDFSSGVSNIIDEVER